MAEQTHNQIANFIWSICNLLRGPYKRNEYRKVILPLTVLRRFDSILAPSKQEVLNTFKTLKNKSQNVIDFNLKKITGVGFYNTSNLSFTTLTNDPNHIAANLNNYIQDFSENVRDIFESFGLETQITRMHEKNLLFEVIKKFAADDLDLSPAKIDHMQMGYIFEELIRIGAEQSNEEAGEIRQQEIKKLLTQLAHHTKEKLFKDRAAFLLELKAVEAKADITLSSGELKAVLEVLSEKDETAEICRDGKGKPEADSDLRDTENVPLVEDVEAYFKREVLPHVPDAWIDYDKTKIGYEIPFNRHFYSYQPPRALAEIEADIKTLESEILELLSEVTGSAGLVR